MYSVAQGFLNLIAALLWAVFKFKIFKIFSQGYLHWETKLVA